MKATSVSSIYENETSLTDNLVENFIYQKEITLKDDVDKDFAVIAKVFNNIERDASTSFIKTKIYQRPTVDKPLPTSNRNFQILQKWLGHVTEITDKFFVADLEDLTHPGTSEIGEFELSEISEDDKPLVAVGAAFYWSLISGKANGQFEFKTILRFQRIKLWKSEDYDKAADRAFMLASSLRWT